MKGLVGPGGASLLYLHRCGGLLDLQVRVAGGGVAPGQLQAAVAVLKISLSTANRGDGASPRLKVPHAGLRRLEERSYVNGEELGVVFERHDQAYCSARRDGELHFFWLSRRGNNG